MCVKCWQETTAHTQLQDDRSRNEFYIWNLKNRWKVFGPNWWVEPAGETLLHMLSWLPDQEAAGQLVFFIGLNRHHLCAVMLTSCPVTVTTQCVCFCWLITTDEKKIRF